MSRNEDILQAIIDGTSASELPDPQSRNEALLIQVLEKLDSSPAIVEVISDSEIDALFT